MGFTAIIAEEGSLRKYGCSISRRAAAPYPLRDNSPTMREPPPFSPRVSAVGYSRVLCSAPEWMKTGPNPGPTRRCRAAP